MQGRSAAFQYLENLQSRYGEKHQEKDVQERISERAVANTLAADGIHPGMPQYQAAREGLLTVLREMEMDLPKRPTVYQDPTQWALMVTAFRSVERGLPLVGYELPTRPILGSLQTGSVQAFGVAVPDDTTRVVLVEDGLFTFSMLAAKVVGAMLPVNNRGAIVTHPAEVFRRLEEDPEPAARLLDLLMAYVVAGSPGGAEPWPGSRKPGSGRVAEDIMLAMEAFVVGHEYGHVVENHFDNRDYEHLLVAGERVTAERLASRKELDADFIALRVLDATTCDLDGRTIRLLAPDVLMTCLQLVDRGVMALSDGDSILGPSGLHPPFDARREHIRASWVDIIGQSHAAELVEFGMSVQHGLEAAWSLQYPAWAEARLQGEKPHRRWVHEDPG